MCGRIYQQTFVDTYSKVAHCKLYVSKTPITAADLLNDRVLPFYESQHLPMLRILTDRGTEYCGRAMSRHRKDQAWLYVLQQLDIFSYCWRKTCSRSSGRSHSQVAIIPLVAERLECIRFILSPPYIKVSVIL